MRMDSIAEVGLSLGRSYMESIVEIPDESLIGIEQLAWKIGIEGNARVSVDGILTLEPSS